MSYPSAGEYDTFRRIVGVAELAKLAQSLPQSPVSWAPAGLLPRRDLANYRANHPATVQDGPHLRQEHLAGIATQPKFTATSGPAAAFQKVPP